MVRLCLEQLKKSRGAIVNTSSKAELTGQGKTSGYVAVKAAQLDLTREWAAVLAPFEVRVNVVLPAEAMTPMYGQWLQSTAEPKKELVRIIGRIPLGQRMITTGKIVDTVVFLLSDLAEHATGQWLHPDGGYTHLDRALA